MYGGPRQFLGAFLYFQSLCHTAVQPIGLSDAMQSKLCLMTWTVTVYYSQMAPVGGGVY